MITPKEWLAEGLQRLWVMRFGPMHAGSFILRMSHWGGLSDTQHGPIREAVARSVPFGDDRLYGWSDLGNNGLQ